MTRQRYAVGGPPRTTCFPQASTDRVRMAFHTCPVIARSWTLYTQKKAADRQPSALFIPSKCQPLSIACEAVS
jgi:hypothetical protein